MVRNNKVTGTSKSIPTGICIGAVTSLAITLIGALLTAWLINFEKAGENVIGYSAMIILMLSSMLGTYVAQAVVKRQRIIVCAATGSAYFLSLLASNALFFGGQYHGIGATALVIAGGVGLIVLVKIKGNIGPNKSMKKYGYG